MRAHSHIWWEYLIILLPVVPLTWLFMLLTELLSQWLKSRASS
jgi:hypothetical protein